MIDLRFWRHVLAHEVKSHLTSAVFLLLAGSSFVLAVFAANAGVRQLGVALQQHDRYVSQKRELAHLPLMGWTSEPALRVVRPPPPGSVLIRGLERSRVAYWDSAPSGLLSGPSTEALDEGSESGPLFDYEALTRILVGLLAVLLGMRTVVGQRHDGTLQALLDLPVRRSTIGITKLSAVLVALACAVVPMWLGSAVAVWVLEPGLMTTVGTATGVFISIASWAYAGTLAALGMVIGSMSRSVTAASGLGIGVWGFLALAYPQLAIFTAFAIAPQPSRPAVEEERSRIYDGRWSSTMEMLGKTAAEIGDQKSGAIQLDHTPGARALIDDLWRQDSAETRYMVRVIDDRAAAAEQRHALLSAWLSAGSPSVVFTRAVAALADTGSTTEARWRNALNRYHADLTGRLFDDPPRFTVLAPSVDAHQRVAIVRHAAPRAADLPPFEAPPDDLGTRLSEAARDLAILAAYFVLFAVLAVVTFPATAEVRRNRPRRA